MSLTQFDSLNSYKDFVGAGMPDAQAEAIIRAIRSSNENAVKDLSTKADLNNTRAELKADIQEVRMEIQEVRMEIQEVRAELKAEIQEVRTELKEVRAELKTEIQEVRAELKTEIGTAKHELIKWIIGSMLALLAVLLGMLLYLK
jgi:chromosome segregation ATPase